MRCNINEKCATANSVLSKNRYPKSITAEQLRRVIEPSKLKKDKAMPRTKNDILIHYCQFTHIEKRERSVINGQEQHINAVNSTYCADKFISYDVSDEFITTAINAGDSTYFSKDAAGGLITAINYGRSTDYVDS